MQEVVADIFAASGLYSIFYLSSDIDAWCITTNGFRKSNGHAVMGAGIAKSASTVWPEMPMQLGRSIGVYGNVVSTFLYLVPGTSRMITVVAFPVKHKWWEVADLELIRQSAHQLVKLTTKLGWRKVVLPRPGAGNGKLEWAQVKEVIEPILDGRFIIVTI